MNITLLRAAVVARLSADAALVALLAEDPRGMGDPAIFEGSANDGLPVFPCLTYRLDDNRRDPRFRPSTPGETGRPIVNVTLEIEAWAQQRSSRPIDSIAARLEALLENQAFSIADLGRVFKTEMALASTDHYDPKLKARFGLFRFLLRLESI